MRRHPTLPSVYRLLSALRVYSDKDPPIKVAAGQEFGVSALVNQLAALDDENLVSPADLGEAMGDE